MSAVDPGHTRDALGAGEALYGVGLTCDEVVTSLRALGICTADLFETNLVTRSAPMGAVPVEVVVATFYNFAPRVVRRVVPPAWAAAPPPAIVAAQLAALAPVLTRALAPLSRPDVAELAALSRAAAAGAAEHPEGRPLLAGLLSIEAPADDVLATYWSGRVLREHRGDGHVVALVGEGITGLEALVLQAAFNERASPVLMRSSRGWTDDEWAAAVDALRERGWLTAATPYRITPAGRRVRQGVEDRTDRLAADAYTAVGDAGIDRMADLGRVVAGLVRAAGLDLEPHLARFRDPATAPPVTRTPEEAP